MSPAEQLTGLNLGNGWTVIEPAKRRPNATGGAFSHGYIVENTDGRRGFLKALDYTAALKSHNTAEMLQAMTTAYIFEQKLCEKCAHLSRVARAIGAGVIHVDESNPFTKVEYLIFELADHDIRAHLDMQTTLDAVFIMNTLHHVATGLAQLHRANIAHQDLKPSNVLIYAGSVGSKICDLGRAWDRDFSGPYDSYEIAGDSTYAPPEFLYFAVPADERARRFGCDLYHLGSLLVFCFTKAHTNGLIFDVLDPAHRTVSWGGSYADVLPFLQAAFESVLTRFAAQVPSILRDELKLTVAELCNPDPARRGHPSNRGLAQFSLERYISRFNKLSHSAQLNLIRQPTQQNG